ncbi:MAG TPA: response regulator transcription factor [Propionibacteriaceae bacterium]|nr:response regulator transcription factor [Propionibacteriaceae bacterium]
MRTVLVVEDERDIRELLRRYLTRAGFLVLGAATGAEALLELDQARADLVLLDLGLPDIDGREILDRATPDIPVIVLTARAALPDRIAGLRAGADDYIVKPFSPTEVVLRVQAVLARRPFSGDDQVRSFDGGRLRIDQGRHEATLDGETLALTPSEWNLLVALTSTPGRVFSRHELIERVGGTAFEGYERAVDSHVKNLRRKLGADGQRIVETVVGFGYRSGVRADG